MNWNTITVRQAQQIEAVRKSIKDEETGLDVECTLLSIVLGIPQSQVDSMGWQEYLNARKGLDFLEVQPSGEAAKYIEVNGKRYRCVYDIRQMPFARYIEGKTFGQDFVGNLHKVAASMVIPQKKVRRFFTTKWVDDTYNAALHEQYANDMLDAPFLTVYASCLFFYHVYRNWIEVSKGYMIAESVKKGLTAAQAVESVNALCNSLDGSITPNLLPTSLISKLARSMNYPQ